MGMKTFGAIALALALAEDVDERVILAEISGLKGKLEAESAARASAETALAVSQLELGARDTKAKTERIDALVALARKDGKLRLKHDEEGKAVVSHAEEGIRALAEVDFAKAERFVADLAKTVPVGDGQRVGKDPTQVSTGEPAVVGLGGVSGTLSDEQVAHLATMGISREDAVKYGMKQLANGKDRA